MRLLLALNRMGLPPPVSTPHRSAGRDRRRDARRSPATTILRAKVALTAIALTAAIALAAVASWPLKVLIILVFIRGLFASDVLGFRSAACRRGLDRTVEPARMPGNG